MEDTTEHTTALPRGESMARREPVRPDWWPNGVTPTEHAVGLFDAGASNGYYRFDPTTNYARPIAGSAMDGNALHAVRQNRHAAWVEIASVVDAVRNALGPVDAVTGMRAARVVVEQRRADLEVSAADVAERRRFADAWEEHPGGAPYIGPTAPDPFVGVRADMVAKRSNSGRTAVTVTRSRAAIVQGRTDATARHAHVVRGAWRPMLQHVNRDGAPVRRPDRRPRWIVTYVPAAEPCEVSGWRRRGAGWNALDVMHDASRFGEHAVSDVRQHAEITPALPAFDPRGVAVHRADMSGQTGVLALTERHAVVSLARWADRNALPLPAGKPRKADPWTVTTLENGARIRHAHGDHSQLMGPADHAGRVTVRTLVRGSLVHGRRRAERRDVATDPGERVWIGHQLVKRGERADSTTARDGQRGNVQRRTIGHIGPDTTPETESGWEQLAEALNRGDRLEGATADGTAWTLNRANDGRWSATVKLHDGTTVRHRARQALAIGRKLAFTTTPA